MPAPIVTIVSLAIVGVAAIVFGFFTWRNAEKITQDARTQLQGMFGASMPALFTAPPSTQGARIAAIAAWVMGVLLIGGAAAVAVVQ